MAIQLSLAADKSGIGTALQSAYVKIGQVSLFEDGRADFDVKFYVSKAARNVDGAAPFRSQRFTMYNFPLNAEAGIKTILYGHLKSLPEFANVVDM